MPNSTYKVVPFRGVMKSGEEPGLVSQQLQSAIEDNSSGGWEFVEVASVAISVKPGCLAGLFGSSESEIHIDQLIFRKSVD